MDFYYLQKLPADLKHKQPILPKKVGVKIIIFRLDFEMVSVQANRRTVDMLVLDIIKQM
jgi:hypothetical protein